MKFGPVAPTRLPKQDPQKVLLLAERWSRSAWAQQRWAERGRVAVDFFEGRQWTEKQLSDLARKRRPSLKFNIIKPLVRLVLGYMDSNKSDITFQPGQDSRSSEQMAEALTRVEKVISEGSKLPYVDTEVFLDGLLCGRGFFETMLNFEQSDFGEIRTCGCDPFSVYLDPDASTYDLNEDHSFIAKSKFVSLDEIEAWFGKRASDAVRPFMMGNTPLTPISTMPIEDEISPLRTFGERADSDLPFWDTFYSLMGDFVDTRRRTIRIIEFECKVTEPKNVVIDLETGDKKVLPDEWKQEQIQKVLLYGQMVGNPLKIERRFVERIQWTTLAGDVMLYDAPSQFDTYSLTGYFPYFRRGFTQGMVEDLIDPQIEKNKRRNARIEIAARTANGGWKYTDGALDPVQERNLQRFGSSPGVNIKYKKGETAPEMIIPNASVGAHKSLEDDADSDIKEIAGVNEAALGQETKIQSGRAIQAKQRQAVLGVQMYIDNFNRAKELLGAKHLNIVQNHYTEPRMYRIMGKDGHFTQVLLNQEQQHQITGVKAIFNDVTQGKYSVVIDDAPISDTFLNAQFQEMLTILEKMQPVIGPFLPMFADLILDMSSMPRKDEWIERIKAIAQHANDQAQAQQQQGQPQGGHPGHPAPHGHRAHGGHPAQPAPQPGPLGGGAVAQNVTPFSHAQQHAG